MKFVPFFLLLLCGIGRADPVVVKGRDLPGDPVFGTVSFTGLEQNGAIAPLPLAQVRLNDAVSATFVLDTGTSGPCITDSLAHKLGIISPPPNMGNVPDSHHAVFNGLMVGKVALPEVQMGSITFTGGTAVVLPDKLFGPLASQVDGIIGMSFLSFQGQVALLFDFPAHKLTYLYPKAMFPAEIKRLGFDAAAVADITPGGDQTYTTTLALTNLLYHAAEPALIDTGAYDTRISAKTAHDLHLAPQGPPTTSGFMGYADSSVLAWTLRLEVGDLKLAHVPIHYLVSGTAQSKSILGMDVLSRFRVLLDFPHNKMYLAPVPPVNAAGKSGK